MNIRQWELDEFYDLLKETNETIYHLSRLFHFDPHHFEKTLRGKKLNDKNYHNAILYLKNKRKEMHHK